MRLVLLFLALLALAPPAAAQNAAVGRWAAAPEHCGFATGRTAKNAALTVTDLSMAWYAGYCQVIGSYKVGSAYYWQARCWGSGPKEIPVMLDPNGDRLKVGWNRDKPLELMRCR